MKKQNTLIITGFILITGISSIFAANEVKSKTPLKFDTYIDSISSALPELKSNELSVSQAENAILRAKASGDITLTGSGKYSSVDQFLQKDVGTVNGYNFSTGVSKKITTTGTDVSTSFDYTKTGYKNFAAYDPYSTYVPGVSLKVSQPLLYNFLGKVDSFSGKDAQMKAEIAKIKLTESNKSILAAYKKLYFQWMISIRVLDILDESVQNSKKQRDQVSRNRRAGLSEDDDYQRAAASVLSYENQYQQYLTSVKNIEHHLSLYIDCMKNMPDEKEFLEYFNRSLKHEYDFMGFDKTNSAKIIDLTLKELDYSKGVGQNKLLPELNVFAGITQKNMTDSSSDAMSTFPNRDYNVGFEFSYKIGTSSASSDLEDIRIQIRSLKYTYNSTLNDYRKSIMEIQESASGTKNLIKNRNSSIETLNLQLAAEKRKYNQGRLGLSYVITTENSIASGKIDLLNLKYQLISYYIDYLDITK